ncbi:MAG: hypothetical protein QOF51_3758 [Chloroflexota bacterium]|jgi:hypothetical protein|nr:hypothetical protein [Chloroflexota bacterium]
MVDEMRRSACKAKFRRCRTDKFIVGVGVIVQVV